MRTHTWIIVFNGFPRVLPCSHKGVLSSAVIYEKCQVLPGLDIRFVRCSDHCVTM